MCASIVAGVNPSPILQFAEHVFDSVALAIKLSVMVDLGLVVGF